MTVVKQRIESLRNKMKEYGMEAYIICTGDYHGSEYIGDYFKAREFFSGFTGSAGTLVVTHTEACLWTDGRYFLQAERQLQGSDIILMRIGDEDIPTIGLYLKNHLDKKSVIGFDGKTVTVGFVKTLEHDIKDMECTFQGEIDIISPIWKDRPMLVAKPVWELDDKYTGMSRNEKMKRLREKLAEQKVDYMVIPSLDEIAWLLNLRGDDIPCNPVFLSFMVVGRNKASLFVNDKVISHEMKEHLSQDGVTILAYEEIYRELSKLPEGSRVLLDTEASNYCIRQSFAQGVEVIEEKSPLILMKAIKNETEYNNMKLAHRKDGIAVTRFMYWIKSQGYKKEFGTEIGAAEKLNNLRKEQEGYLGPSFDPIMAYGSHGAIVHYSATEETNSPLLDRGFLLSDTGGQYYEGTTDITRTFALGPLTQEEKRNYTLVLKGHLRLAATKFLYGVRGENLDIICRQPLWEYGLDYNHGTGHGVGYLLNVHEGPNRFHWRIREQYVTPVLEEGMITSDEPGVYIAGKFGIRLENLILCKKLEKKECGQLMGFEYLTMVPFDLEAVDVEYLSDEDINLLNAYHRWVYENLSSHLPQEERLWLKQATRAISKVPMDRTNR